MQDMELHFVTGNQGKVSEASQILGFPIKIANIDLPEIQSLDLEEIVKVKASVAYEQIKKPLFVDDAGLFIAAWNQFPGPFIKYIYEAGGSKLLLHMLGKEINREATFKSTVGFYDGVEYKFFAGEVSGIIVNTPRGQDGWGFDPVFQPEGSELTFSEMGEEKKNSLSHRYRALEKFKAYLNERNDKSH